VVGAFRKLVLADSLSLVIPWDVFEAPENFWAGELWGWLFIYGFALYNDFAGYTNLARGISGLFGIELSLNFQQPYFARNFGEFWNSWHRTLSHWLRDYIYFPTLRALLRRNRNRRNLRNIVVPPLATMLVSGLWHGFSLHMVVWGGLHGIYQIGERILSLGGAVVPPDKRPWWRQLLAMLIVFLLVMVAWVPFKVEMPIAVQFWKQLLSFGTFEVRYRRLFLVAIFVLITLIIDLLQRRFQDEVVFLRWPRLAKAAALAIVIFLVIIVSSGDVSEPFVYQGF
jgi:D-alanyl-lipoteichoic acid acyltransferase DltB (MBOAT superfamily)